jgi:acyl transferase domain-containing protein
MTNQKAIAVVGLGAILPDAFDVPTFWNNIINGKYSIGEVPSDRWSTALYYDPDPAAVDKTYAKIGAFVRGYQFDPLKNGIAIPPKVLAMMDQAQQWAIAASQQALKDYGSLAMPTRAKGIIGLHSASCYLSIWMQCPPYRNSQICLSQFANPLAKECWTKSALVYR